MPYGIREKIDLNSAGERMLTTLLLWTQLAMASMPTPIQLTETDLAKLSKGEAVIRDSGDGMAIGIIDVNASPKSLWTEVINVEPRVDEVGPSTMCTITERSEEAMKVTWGAGMLGMSVTFHLDYIIDHKNMLLSFDLDKTKENGIGHSRGSYQVLPRDSGSRLIYRSEDDPSSNIPKWMRSMLTGRPLKDQMHGIRKRAEAH